MATEVAPGTVVVFTDVVCGWSTLALHRFYRARRDAGLDDAVRVDHQLFLLEDINRFPVPKRYLDTEIPVIGALAPDLEWKPWQGDASTWPITSLLPNEAVHAAKRQSLAAAEQLDMALRSGFFSGSRPISLLHEIIDIAENCDRVDAAALRSELEAGSARAAMMRTYRRCVDAVQGSPHFFLADGSDVHSPGLQLHWEGEPGAGFPVVDADDPTAIEALVQRAAQRPQG